MSAKTRIFTRPDGPSCENVARHNSVSSQLSNCAERFKEDLTPEGTHFTKHLNVPNVLGFVCLGACDVFCVQSFARTSSFKLQLDLKKRIGNHCFSLPSNHTNEHLSDTGGAAKVGLVLNDAKTRIGIISLIPWKYEHCFMCTRLCQSSQNRGRPMVWSISIDWLKYHVRVLM